MHFDECQFDYLANMHILHQKCRKKHRFYIFTNNPPYPHLLVM